MPRSRSACLCWSLNSFIAGIVLATGYLCLLDRAGASMGGGFDGRYRLLFDDFYQIARPKELYSQGVALKAHAKPLSNTYSPEATATANGTFALSQIIADKFRLEISEQPIDETLLRATDAYMLVCPVKPDSGGRAPLTEREAALLEDFVARGGMLILVMNSSTSAKGRIDWEGMNRIARRFGLEFLKEETKTLSAPVAKDHPLFDGIGSRGLIFGNGTTLRVLAVAAPATLLLLKDPREAGDHAPLGVIAPFKKGRVLAFGDAGTLGNAHMFRHDFDHANAVRQMFYGLLPDGPVPAYGWKKGLRLRVHIKHEQIISSYQHEHWFSRLPKAEGSELIQFEAAETDLISSSEKEEASKRSRYASTLLRKEASFWLEIGAYDGRSFAADWQWETGKTIECRFLPNGRTLGPSAGNGDSDLAPWQWVLNHAIICGPLKSYARPGEIWEAEEVTPLPHTQLSPVPTLRRLQSTYRFEGETAYKGNRCFLFSRTAAIEANDWRIDDLVSPEAIAQFGPEQIELVTGGQLVLTRFWVNCETLLPVHTEMKITSALWWKDIRYPERFEGHHDWRGFENWKNIIFVATLGRTIVADFETE